MLNINAIFALYFYSEEKMNTSMFYGKRTPGVQTRVPPSDSEDSCLSESGDTDEDEEYRPAPGDENSSNKVIITVFPIHCEAGRKVCGKTLNILIILCSSLLLAKYLWMSQ